MARYSEYISESYGPSNIYSGYLPGDVARAGTSQYRRTNTPMDITDYIASKRFKFSPDKEPPDGGEKFQTFLALQANPDALVQNKLKNNPGFLNAISMLKG